MPCRENFTPSAKYKYTVPGIVPSFAQPTAQTCWATVTTMMVSWYDNTPYTIVQVMDQAGRAYRTKFDNNRGLSHTEKAHFLATLGLYEEPATHYTAAILYSLMQAYGPLLMTTVGVPTEDFAIHARVLTGICGGGSPENTLLHVNNPTDGQTYTDSLSKIRQNLGCAEGTEDELWIQIVHF